jgi:hypothetical protein
MKKEKNDGSKKQREFNMIKSQKASTGVWIIGIILFIVLMIFFIIPVIINPPLRGFAREVRQKAQFHAIGVALEIFNSQIGYFPPSDRLDPNGIPYCGAMKLAEAMVGQDLMGFDPNSVFRCDGKDSAGKLLYDPVTSSVRKGPYLPIENANAYLIQNIYATYGNFLAKNLVLTDVFSNVTNKTTKQKIGMPILYYKADPNKSSHDVNNPDNPDNIYNYKDNIDLLALGVPGKPGVKHPLYEDPSLFYIMTQNYNITSKSEPFNKDSYILISAGPDGLFGTQDDITNFDFKWRPKKEIKK